MSQRKFTRYLGRSALAGRLIAVYENGEGFIVAAETIGGGPVLFEYADARGRTRTAAIQARKMSAAQFDAFEDRCRHGVLGPSDVLIVERALNELRFQPRH
jgi:hypothetical protein